MLKVRRMLEQQKVAEGLFSEMGHVLQGSGMKLKTRARIVDVSIIAAPSLTKKAHK